MKRIEMVLSLLVVLMLFPSCGSKTTTSNQNASPSVSKTEEAQGPSFELLNVWQPKKVVLEGYATVTEGAPKFTITPKAGSAFLAVELMLQHDDPKRPIPASVWSGLNLVDSAGQSHHFIFSYPATRAKYSPGGDSVEYAGDESAKSGDIGKNLNEMGKKLVTVFEAPAKETEFKIEVEGGKPIQVKLQAK